MAINGDSPVICCDQVLIKVAVPKKMPIVHPDICLFVIGTLSFSTW